MRVRISIATLCLGLCVGALAQNNVPELAAPAAAGYSAADPGGTMESGPLSGAEVASDAAFGGRVQGLNTSLRYSQVVDSGVAGAESSQYAYSGAISGQLGLYVNSAHHRTILSYDGGGMFHTRSGQETEQFHTFSFSHAFDVRRWSFMLANDISYASQGSYGGGLPGVSNIGPVLSPGQIIPSLLPAQNVLTFDNPRLSSAYVGQAQYHFSRRNSMTAVFSYGLAHFFETSLLNSRQMGGSLGFDRKLSAVSTLALRYGYQRFTYASLGPAMESHSPQLMYERQFSSRLSAQLSLGPQIVTYATFGQPGRRSKVSGAGSASLSYRLRYFDTSLAYSRDVNNGSGLVNGAAADSVSLSMSRTIARHWRMAAFGGYTRTSGLAQSASFNTRSVGGQVSRDIGKQVGIHFSYTMQSQSRGGFQTFLPAYGGMHHVFGMGVDWHTQVPAR